MHASVTRCDDHYNFSNLCTFFHPLTLPKICPNHVQINIHLILILFVLQNFHSSRLTLAGLSSFIYFIPNHMVDINFKYKLNKISRKQVLQFTEQ